MYPAAPGTTSGAAAEPKDIMSLNYGDEKTTVWHGDCIEVMQTMNDDSVDSIVTDPPYGLGLGGKAWDSLPPGEDWARECLRVLKPGGHLLAFGGTRTWHRLAVAVEDAGFEIRDSIAWMYGSGMPRNKATLKPAFEPIVMARKPFTGTVAANDAIYGTGYLGIDSCRIATTDTLGGGASSVGLSAEGRHEIWARPWMADSVTREASRLRSVESVALAESLGRYPANVILDEFQSAELDASKYFYVAKAPKSERPIVDGVAHPTVKPLALMRWLVRLATPVAGVVLDPFAGSGTTLEAAALDGFKSIGIEREAEYLPLIQARIERAVA